VAEDLARNAPPFEHFHAYAVTGYFGLPLGTDEIRDLVEGWLAASRAIAERAALEQGLTGAEMVAHVAAHRFDAASDWAAQELLDGAISGERFLGGASWRKACSAHTATSSRRRWQVAGDICATLGMTTRARARSFNSVDRVRCETKTSRCPEDSIARASAAAGPVATSPSASSVCRRLRHCCAGRMQVKGRAEEAHDIDINFVKLPVKAVKDARPADAGLAVEHQNLAIPGSGRCPMSSDQPQLGAPSDERARNLAPAGRDGGAVEFTSLTA